MKVSVIIPTYNEYLVIDKCLESLSKQDFKDFEIIIVDDGSTDSTVKNLSQFLVFHQNHKGAGAARNLGASHARGEILVFVDADMTFNKDFLSNIIKPIESGKVKGTFSKEEYVSNWNNVWARCWNINEGWEEKRRHPKNYPDHQPVFRSILKSEFDKVGGFTPGGYDDDWSLSKKLGYEAINAPGAIFYHNNPSSLIEIYKHTKWVGKRKYKYGYFGYIVGMIRSTLPVSLVVGICKSVYYCLPAFMIFKIVYDFGIFVGIGEVLIYKKSSK